MCVCVCVSAKQKLGQEQAKYTHNAKSAQEPGSQLELDGSSATRPNTETLYSLSIYTYTVCDWKQEDDLPVSRSMDYIFPYFPLLHFYISDAVLPLVKGGGTDPRGPSRGEAYIYGVRQFYCKSEGNVT